MTLAALQERRNRQILADIVRTYIETGEPVSSRVISARFEESLSTATIRNIMAELEEGGFLYQPHTSAGRLPTAAAYRFFAQEIASQATISAVDKEWIQREIGGATSAAEINERAGHVLPQNLVIHAQGIAQNALTLCDPAVLGEDLSRQIHVEGAAQMVGALDFASQSQLRDLLSAIEEKQRLVTVLNACIETPEPVHVQIGIKGISEGGDNLAVISAPYTRNDLVQGSLGVLGPTRMHYERAITAVAYVAELFSEALNKI